MSPYLSNGTLTTDKRTVDDAQTWDTQTEWEAYQSVTDVEIVNGAVQLAEVAVPATAIAWYDATQDGSASGPITTIPDQLGNHDLSGTAQLDTNSINAKNSYFFDGLDDEMSAAFAEIAQPITLFIVYRHDKSTTASGNPFSAETAPTTGDDFRITTGAGQSEITIDGGSAFTEVGSTTNNPTLLTVVFDGANSVARQDGAQIASGDLGTNGLNGILLGNLARADVFFEGPIAEVLPLEESASQTTIDEQEQRMADKWGITLP